jgi:hypothetical protein
MQQNAEVQDALMTVPEFCKKVLRCSEAKGWTLVAEGAFPVIRNGRMVRVDPVKARAAFIQKFTVG